jgi:hypothetical protein
MAAALFGPPYLLGPIASGTQVKVIITNGNVLEGTFLQEYDGNGDIGFLPNGRNQQPQGLITENFIRSDIRLNKHIKSFVRPSVVVRVENPHYYVITNKNRYYSCNGTKIKMGPFNEQPLPFIKTLIYIAHFYTQSEEEHFRRKSRSLDDGSVNKAKDLPDLHKLYNDVINNQLQNKYSLKIKKYNLLI